MLSPNIGRTGRFVRGAAALAVLAGALYCRQVSTALALILLGLGAFLAFEALRGWCALRACGIRTRL